MNDIANSAGGASGTRYSLLDGHAFRAVPRFVDRPIQLVGHPVQDQLQLHVRQHRRQLWMAGGHLETVTGLLEDLFELPCLAAMDERLQEKKPVRKDLFNLVRMIWWLPQYQDVSMPEVISDMKDLVSRWPWYDEEVTEYQIWYELSNDIGGEAPFQ